MKSDTSADLPIDPRDLQDWTEGWILAGATHLPNVAEVSRTMESPDAVSDPNLPITTEPRSDRTTSQKNMPIAMTAMTLDEKQNRLQVLAQRVARCVRCQELAETRTQTVFGVGDPNAKIMFIGEAPGADEDREGEPFVGRAGQLLNKIIEACKLTREEIYICNILRCRPPENRNPLPAEAENCREYLDGQIEIVRPEYIVCWGSVAAKNLLGTDSPIGKLRGKFYEYAGAKVLCTYHPSYLLRNPPAKKDVWEDLKFLFCEMGITLE
ncbi:MAG TPA: uracil-DNA glycosylase [Planctomycetaceae bacterium]|nr:uracil-DNA glycosylase [Planctomycetaceae bacterium]